MNRKQRRANPPQRDGVAALFASGVAEHRLGRLAEAERLYREALALNPRHADSLHLLGVLVQQAGRGDGAALIRQAIALDPRNPGYYSNLGNILRARSEADEAVAAYRRALALKPDFAEAHGNLGAALKDQGEVEAAIVSYRRALALNPKLVDVHCNLGNALKDQGKLEEAAASYARAIEINPNFANAHNNLGNVLRARGDSEAAVACYAKALEIIPSFALAHGNLGAALTNLGRLDEAIASARRAIALDASGVDAHITLGNALKEQGRLDEAIDTYRRAIVLSPGLAPCHFNLGNALKDRRDLAGAAEAYERAIALDPGFYDAWSNLGNLRQDQSRLDDAVGCYERALMLKPDFAEAYVNLANSLKELGRLDDAVATYARVLALKPDFATARSNLLLVQHYLPQLGPADLLAAARRFGDCFRDAAPAPAFARERADGRRLRIGYVSGDFRRHPVGYFFERALAAHDRSRFDIFCYSNNEKSDSATERLRASAEHWRTIAGVSDTEAEAAVRRDEIDILVDLSGHTAKNRLSLFALKPAPVQASWIGYFGSTGLAAMDYVLMDEATVPRGEERWFTEAVVRLPYGRFCYAPPDYAPPVADPPALSRGYVTFGSFNNVAKIAPEVASLWAAALSAAPGSRLVLKWKSLDDDTARRRLADVFAQTGIEAGRLELRGFSPHAAMLAEYAQIDVALDPLPFGGGTTSCEALWMGVPVVTWPGERPASRQTLGFLAQLGLAGDCVAVSAEDYVARAAALAADPARLLALRRSLRPAMAASPLCDAARFTPTLEAAFEGMWRRWRNGLAAESFDAPAGL